MSKLYIDGKLVAKIVSMETFCGCQKIALPDAAEIIVPVAKFTCEPAREIAAHIVAGLGIPASLLTGPTNYSSSKADSAAFGVTMNEIRLHASGECLTLPTYFCPHCAREALAGVDVSDPSGWRGA